MDFNSFVRTMEHLKKLGVSRQEVLDVLEFDSDQYPDMEELKRARDQVYGKERQTGYGEDRHER